MNPFIWDALPVQTQLEMLHTASINAETFEARQLAKREHTALFYSLPTPRRHIANLYRMLADLPPLPVEPARVYA